jgi:hypothetical protein
MINQLHPPKNNIRFTPKAREGLVWFGLVWFGLVWFGLVWFGLVLNQIFISRRLIKLQGKN